MCVPDNGRFFFVLLRAPSREVGYNTAKVQNLRCTASNLKVLWYGSMKWNMEENFSLVWNKIWNGRFLVWNGNGIEENCQYGIWKNQLPFHFIPCPALIIRRQ